MASTPKYYGVKTALLESIVDARPGTPLAPERELAERFSTSRTTIRQALAELVIEGRLERTQGRGTFVAHPKVAQALQLTSYTQDMQAAGRRPASRLLAVETIGADIDLAEKLAIEPGSDVVQVTRLRLADDSPMAVETSHLDGERFPKLEVYLRNGASLYATLSDVFDVHLAEAVETIETVLCPPRVAEILETETGAPMLLLCRHSRDSDGRPVEFVRSLYRGDRYKFVTTLTPPAVHETAP